MTDEEILAAIAGVAREHLGYQGTLEPGMRLIEALELDSVRLLTLAMEVEHRFGICLDETDGESIERVADLVRAVGRKLGRSAAAPPPG